MKKKTKRGKHVSKYKLKVKWVHKAKQAMRSQLINTPRKKKKKKSQSPKPTYFGPRFKEFRLKETYGLIA